MTPFVWMFIKNYKSLRNYIINKKSISSLIQLEYSAFSEATVPICTFILSNFNEKYAGTYLKLSDFTGGMDVQKEKVLQIINGDEVLNDRNKYIIKQFYFNKIPGSPLVYWANKILVDSFNKGILLKDYAYVKQGLSTADNKRFLRQWFEVNYEKIGFNFHSLEDAKLSKYKWFPHNKGGNFKKWYGNQDYVVNWENDGYELRNFKKSVLRNSQFYFHKSLSWSKISSGKAGFRFYPTGFLFDNGGGSIFFKKGVDYYLLAFLNSSVGNEILSYISPTLNYEIGHISLLPLITSDVTQKDEIKNIVLDNIQISKRDWDDNELSWYFSKHPLLYYGNVNLSKNFNEWSKYKKFQFNKLKSNEIVLNKLFSKIYNTNVKNDIENKFISLNLADYEQDVKSFISYSVGCMFGRYSLDNEGLQFAGGEFNINNYHKFIPDDDNIIPVLDSEYFEDDIVGRFVEFVKTCFGEENLEENLDFIADALSKNKKPSREKIRDYLLKNFFNDHKKTYKKCPIYWQFSSGKENGFNCLIYMHRYEPSLVARIRTDYLHKTQKAIEQRIANNDSIINNSTNKTEIAKATKEKAKLQKQLKETQDYDEVLAHVANQNIEIDLDDGVKVNYAKFQNIEIKKEGSKTKKVNLLKKI